VRIGLPSRRARTCAALTLVLGALPGAQEPVRAAVFPAPRHSGVGRVPFASQGVALLAWWTLDRFPGGSTAANDCWGHTSPTGREYAVLGLSDGTAFVEVTDPGAPTLVAFHAGPTSLWRAVKTRAGFAYAASEGGGGIQVFDLTAIDAGTVALVNTVQSGGITTATHTLAVDEASGFLYRAGGGLSQGLVIYDLADPAAPVVAGQWQTSYVHEVQVVVWDQPGPWLGRQIALCAMGLAGTLKILDVTDKGALAEIATLPYPGAVFAHQCWLADDHRTLYLNDELDDETFGGARTRIVDVSDLAAPAVLGTFGSTPTTDHNLYVRGARLYESNFQSGLRLFDVSDPRAPLEIGSFDTYPEGDGRKLNALAYNYPFFASGTIVGSDVEKGLFLWREGPPGLAFAFEGGVPELVDPAGETLVFTVSEATPGTLEAGSVRLRVSTGGAFTDVPASPLGGDRWAAALPPLPCGTALAFALAARDTSGVTWTDPPAAPTQVHLAHAALARRRLFLDTLESGPGGWQAGAPGDTATTGQWTLVNPVGTDAQPEDDATPDGVFCFVTGQATPGAPLNENDVDGGITTLLSPVLDASLSPDPFVAYWRWYSGFQTLAAIDDPFVVELSNDAGATWVELERLEPAGQDSLGGWIRHEARIGDFLPPTATMRLRFTAQDLGAGSTVEAAIDDLELLDYPCTPVTVASIDPPTGPPHGGTLVLVTGSGFLPGLTTVRFGGRAAPEVQVLSPTTLLARTPPAALTRTGRLARIPSPVDVTVLGPGEAELVAGFSYAPSPSD